MQAAIRDKEEKGKAKRFSQRMQSSKFMKQPKTLMLVPAKSADEEDEEDTILEGFHLHAESPHCLNMQQSGDFQAYL